MKPIAVLDSSTVVAGIGWRRDARLALRLLARRGFISIRARSRPTAGWNTVYQETFNSWPTPLKLSWARKGGWVRRCRQNRRIADKKGLPPGNFPLYSRYARAAGKRPRTRRAINRAQILQKVTTPLGFYVLTLLILEGTLSIVLTCSKLTEEHIWSGFLWMVGVFIGVVILVSLFVWKKPESLLFEKEQYLPPQLDTSALRDQIEDLIYTNVKPESLQKHESRGE